MTPDLDTPVWQLLLIAAALWLVVALLCAYDRHRRRRADQSPLRPGTPVSAHRHEPTDRDRVVHGHHGAGHGADRDRFAGVAEQARLNLSEDELVALARYLDRASMRVPLVSGPVQAGVDYLLAHRAVSRVMAAASDALNAERVNRRG